MKKIGFHRFYLITASVLTLIVPSIGWTQLVTNNQATISITSNTDVAVEGGFANGGTVINNGNIIIEGNWQNTNTYTPGQGYIRLVSSNDQTFSHNDQSIYGLIIQGGGAKYINGDVDITNELWLDDGIVMADPNGHLVVRSGATLNGGSEASYVDGSLYHEGTGFKFYPVGTNGNYLPVELIDVQGLQPVQGIEAIEPNISPIFDSGLISVSERRYWKRSLISGNYTGSLIKLRVLDEIFNDINSVEVAQAPQEGGIFERIGNSEFIGSLFDGFITSADPATGLVFTIGESSNLTPGKLYIPNALSPLAPDPEDQVVKLYGENISSENFSFRVFNRWGNLVYETFSFDEANLRGWNGTHYKNGKLLSLGVYTYVIKGMYTDESSFQLKGTITIVR